MPTPSKTLIDLENRFWQAIVDQDADTAIDLLNEPALLVSAHGAMKFDHAGYRQMAEQGTQVLTAFELSDMNVVFPNDSTAVMTYHVRQKVSGRANGESTAQEMNDTSTWIRQGNSWRCVMHTETPAGGEAKKN